jgi:hypothetical protein
MSFGANFDSTKRVPKTIGVLIVAIALLTVTLNQILALNPLRRSENEIHDWALTKAPLGSSTKAVEDLIIGQGWKRSYDWKGSASDISENFYPGVKGSQIIGAGIGQYRGLSGTVYVDAYWGFDSAGKLISLRVRKMRNAL